MYFIKAKVMEDTKVLALSTKKSVPVTLQQTAKYPEANYFQ